MRHSVVTGFRLSVASKVKNGVLSRVGPLGPPVICTVGGVVSTRQLRVAGDGSTLPAASRTAIWTVWVPSARPSTVHGDTHGAAARLSRAHVNDAPGPASGD